MSGRLSRLSVSHGSSWTVRNSGQRRDAESTLVSRPVVIPCQLCKKQTDWFVLFDNARHAHTVVRVVLGEHVRSNPKHHWAHAAQVSQFDVHLLFLIVRTEDTCLLMEKVCHCGKGYFFPSSRDVTVRGCGCGTGSQCQLSVPRFAVDCGRIFTARCLNAIFMLCRCHES